MSKLIPKYQEGNKLLDEYSKYVILDTYYPFVSKYPFTGHSKLRITGSKNDKYRPYDVDKGEKHKNYNLVTNNCSDATRCALEKTFNKKINPFLFTTPGDVQDFALEELNGIPEIKGDSIYYPAEHKYKLNLRPELTKRLHKGVSTVYIPINENQRNFLKQYIEQGNKNKEFKKGGILKYQNSGKFSHYTDEQKVLLKRNDEATQNLHKLHNSNTIKNNGEQIQKEVDLVQNTLNQQANQFKELGTLYKQASDNQVQKAKDEFYPYKNMANSLATAGELLSAGYFLAKGVGKGAQLGTKLIGTRKNRYGFPVFSGKWRERYDKIGKFLNTWDRGQVAMNSLGTTSDVGQLLMGDNSWQNKAEIGLDIGGVVGGANIVRNTPWFGRYRKAIDSTLDAGGYSAAGYDIYNYLNNE